MSGQSENHVADLIHQLDPGSMVTKFIVIAEVIDTDGDQAVWVDTSDGSSTWDILGLLAYAKALQTSRLDFDDLEDLEDEDGL